MKDNGQSGFIDVSGEGIYEHRIGDGECCDGWCGGGGWGNYPKPCRCGGLIHADFGDDGPGGYWLYRRCDQCGGDWEEEGE